MNSVQILGNLTRDPDVRFTASGRALASFSVATTYTYIDSKTNETKEMTSFVNCVAWGKLGESVGQLHKGNRVFVEGRIQSRSYETQDGQKRYVTEVVANFIGQSLDSAGTLGMPSEANSSSSNFNNFGNDGGKSGSDNEEIPF